MGIREDAQRVMDAALRAAQPAEAVRRALRQLEFPAGGRVVAVAVGKAAFAMAAAALEELGERIGRGIVITKYGHAPGELPRFVIREAGHPSPDGNTFSATGEAMRMVEGLGPEDTVLTLISGGGSALFESPLVTPEELQDITRQLLRAGADIRETNAVRKRLSRVKGGRFALHCQPARVASVLLSDVIGDPPDVIASGPTVQDRSTCRDALAVAEKYGLALSAQAAECLRTETPRSLPPGPVLVTGSVRELCRAAEKEAGRLGYRAQVLTDSLVCQAREAGSVLASVARYHQGSEESLAFILGGETVVVVRGKGRGGRNQELALSAAEGIAGCRDTAVFSLGSDGTDGPTDAAGGYADGDTAAKLAAAGISVHGALQDNDAYPALQAVGGLLMTGPTGTNVNDLSVLLIRRHP